MSLLLDLANTAVEITKCARFVVNIGAAQAYTYNDPTIPLYETAYSGISYDVVPDGNNFINWPYVCTPVLPSSMPAIDITNYAVLKIDMDSYDGPVMVQFLRMGHRPAVIQVEVQPEIPPALAFSVLESKDFKANGHFGFYGASLGWITKQANLFGYRPVAIDFESPYCHDVILAQDELFDLPTIDIDKAWRAAPMPAQHLLDAGVRSVDWRNLATGPVLYNAVRFGIDTACLSKYGQMLPYELEWAA